MKKITAALQVLRYSYIQDPRAFHSYREMVKEGYTPPSYAPLCDNSDALLYRYYFLTRMSLFARRRSLAAAENSCES